MPSKPETPPIHRVPPGMQFTIDFGSATGWEEHPDGKGGYWPVDPSRRGSINVPCEACGKPLVREGSKAIVISSTFGCPKPCGARYVGSLIWTDIGGEASGSGAK